jgi:hypothetical protein
MRRYALPALVLFFFTLCPNPGAYALTDDFLRERERADEYAEENEASPPPSARQEEDGFASVEWDVLVPRDWRPESPFAAFNLDEMEDNDPRLDKAMETFRKLWDEAPVERSLDGKSIRIAGFIVPLDFAEQDVAEFLLVPYFGACIHVPPPPANQIIHVVLRTPARYVHPMDPVWVYGTLGIDGSDTEMGKAGYTMAAVKVERYTLPPEEYKE